MNDEQAIRETISNWLSASKAGDSQALAAMLDENAIFVVLDRPPFGRKEFLAGSQGKPYQFDSTADITEIVVHGDWALTRVQLAIEMTAVQGGKSLRLKGPTMSVWRKTEAGRWVIWRDANMVVPIVDAGHQA